MFAFKGRFHPAPLCTESPSLPCVSGGDDDAEMSSSSGFNDEKGGSSSVGEPEYGHDPASGGIFSSDYKRYRGVFTSQRITVEVNGVDARDFCSFSSRVG